MWYEGSLLRWEDPSEDLVKFYEENEHKSLDLTEIDDDSVWQEGQEELDYILDNTQLPWIPVPINVPWKDIYEEAHHLLHTACYTAHRPNSSGWLSLAIHGMSSVHTNCPEDYGLPDSAEKDLSGWTDIAKFCPRTVEWMKDEVAYDQFTRVRFMAVLPGGWLAPHTDRSRITGVGATNVAINNPAGCAMVMRDFGVFPFEPGTAFKINTGYEHAVWNRSDEPRIHMIFDGDQSDRFKERVREGYGKLLGKI
jgi:hypothetical protein